MKKIVSMLFALLILTGTVPTFALELPSKTEIQENIVLPRYMNITVLAPGLKIDSYGKATCTGAVTLSNGSCQVELTVTLQKKEGTNWSLVKFWSKWGTGTAGVLMDNTYYVMSGTYRVAVTAKVYNSSGTLIETQTQYSKEVTY